MRSKPVHAWFSVSWKTHVCVFFDSFFSGATAKVSERTNRNLPVRNTLVQLLALYADPEKYNAQRYRQKDRRQDDTNSRSYQKFDSVNRYVFIWRTILPNLVAIRFETTELLAEEEEQEEQYE